MSETPLKFADFYVFVTTIWGDFPFMDMMISARSKSFSGWKNHRCRLSASSNALFKAKEILQAKHEFDRSSAWSSWSSGYLWRMHVSILNSNVLKYPQQTPKTFWCVSCTTTSLWGLFLWLTLKFSITKTGYWANSRNQHYWFQFNCKTS